MRRKKHSLSAKAERRARASRLAEAVRHTSTAGRLVAVNAFIRAHISSELLANEPELADSCWIEYAYMTPLDRTQLFVRTYVDVYRKKWEQYFDCTTAADKCPADEDFALNEQVEMTGFWKARQHADAIGMPYLTYLNQVFEHATQSEGHKKLLRPNQLYSPPQVDHAIKYWETWRGVQSLHIDDWDERFRAENYVGAPPQVRLHDLIEERVKDENGVASFVIYRPVIPEGIARERFGDELVDHAIRKAGPVPTGSPDEHPPHAKPCLGLAFGLASACHGCKLAEFCSLAVSKVSAVSKVAYGSADPVTDRRRQVDRERQRRHRQRKRATIEPSEG